MFTHKTGAVVLVFVALLWLAMFGAKLLAADDRRGADGCPLDASKIGSSSHGFLFRASGGGSVVVTIY